MAKSSLTLAELQAAALLLGERWFYDWNDHTFNCSTPGETAILSADTMEPLGVPGNYPTYATRIHQVKDGLLGANDLGF